MKEMESGLKHVEITQREAQYLAWKLPSNPSRKDVMDAVDSQFVLVQDVESGDIKIDSRGFDSFIKKLKSAEQSEGKLYMTSKAVE